MSWSHYPSLISLGCTCCCNIWRDGEEYQGCVQDVWLLFLSEGLHVAQAGGPGGFWMLQEFLGSLQLAVGVWTWRAVSF